MKRKAMKNPKSLRLCENYYQAAASRLKGLSQRCKGKNSKSLC